MANQKQRSERVKQDEAKLYSWVLQRYLPRLASHPFVDELAGADIAEALEFYFHGDVHNATLQRVMREVEDTQWIKREQNNDWGVLLPQWERARNRNPGKGAVRIPTWIRHELLSATEHLEREALNLSRKNPVFGANGCPEYDPEVGHAPDLATQTGALARNLRQIVKSDETEIADLRDWVDRATAEVHKNRRTKRRYRELFIEAAIQGAGNRTGEQIADNIFRLLYIIVGLVLYLIFAPQADTPKNSESPLSGEQPISLSGTKA